MRYLLTSVFASVLAFTAIWQMTVSAADTDTSLLDKENAAVAPNFNIKTFASCGDMRQKVADFMELYFDTHPNSYRGGPILYDKAIPPAATGAPTAAPTAPGGAEKATDTSDHSTTNTRTIGVDEPERVKTDGTYLYSASDTDHMVYIHKADDSLALVKRIALPQEYSNTQLFVDGNRLVIVSGKYVWNNIYRSAWVDRTNKTVVVVYDITDINHPKIDRYFQVDGYFGEARLVNNQLTVLATASFNFPWDRYLPKADGTNLVLDVNKLATDFTTANVLPKKIEIAPMGPIDNVGDYLDKSRKAHRLRELDASSCANVSYVFPDKKTLESYNFSPSFTTITTFDIRSKTKSATKVLFGDVGKAYLSANDNLYITSTLYAPYPYSCPPGAMCAMLRPIPSGSNTVVHKFAVTPNGARYQATGIVPGSLITDYAIDESASGNVRLVTHQTSGTKPDNILTTLSPQLAQISSLNGIAVGENFQAARFIGDKLYLVTFQQIDPFFVIDVADPANPKILGQLKIPGYSTYLHPYDDTHLIGIGYDTATNQWGGTQNSGIKVDLYDISDFANPKQVSSLTLGSGAGSYSDALNNPRLFVWQKSRNMLYLPATLYTTLSGSTDLYRYSDVFQGVVAISIDPKNGVVEKARTTQIAADDATLEAQRAKECQGYTAPKTPVCHKLIGGGEYCDSTGSTYVPNYCYADSPIGEYRASHIWNYSSYFIDRSLYVGNRLFTFSPVRIEALDIDNGLAKKGSATLGNGVPTPKPMY